MEGLDLVQLWTTAPALVTVIIILQWQKTRETESIRREREYSEGIAKVYRQLIDAQVEWARLLAETKAEVTALRHETMTALRQEIHALKNTIQTFVLKQAAEQRRDSGGDARD